MSDTNNGGPAFPLNEKRPDGEHWHSWSGISIRDYFAAKADMRTLIDPSNGELLGAACVMPNPLPCGDDKACVIWLLEAEAKLRYMFADAMLAAREAK